MLILGVKFFIRKSLKLVVVSSFCLSLHVGALPLSLHSYSSITDFVPLPFTTFLSVEEQDHSTALRGHCLPAIPKTKVTRYLRIVKSA